jgi:hypothetical protein
MKHCPACNFSFPDTQGVCDFDGTELIMDPGQQSLMKVKQPRAFPQPSLLKSMLLTSLAVLGIFLSAVFIGYLESPSPSVPTVKNQEAQKSPPNLTTVAKTTGPVAEAKKTNEPSTRTVSRSRNKSAFSTARLSQRHTENRPRNEEIAQTRDSKRTSSEKSPKIVAVLKTTWRVLKKPFDF